MNEAVDEYGMLPDHEPWPEDICPIEAQERFWNPPAPMRSHECKSCGWEFRADARRGNLAHCDQCADAIEAGFDVGA